MSLIRNVNLHDGYGNPIGSLTGAINIHDADVHNVLINRYAHQLTAVSTTITTATIGDGSVYQIDVADATGFSVGDNLLINTTNFETTFPTIISTTAATGAATFTLDRRLDLAHSIGDTVTKVIIDMSSQVGTIAGPQEYYIGPSAGEVWHIERLLFEMVSSTGTDLTKFGGIAALTNGTVLRKKINSVYTTLTNWKTNAEIKADIYDVEFDTRSGGATSGTTGKGAFSDVSVAIKLDGDTGDKIEVYIQDDISLLTTFTMKFQGHVEGA